MGPEADESSEVKKDPGGNWGRQPEDPDGMEFGLVRKHISFPAFTVVIRHEMDPPPSSFWDCFRGFAKSLPLPGQAGAAGVRLTVFGSGGVRSMRVAFWPRREPATSARPNRKCIRPTFPSKKPLRVSSDGGPPPPVLRLDNFLASELGGSGTSSCFGSGAALWAMWGPWRPAPSPDPCLASFGR